MANAFDNERETPEMETLASLAENLVYLLPGCTDLMVRKALQEVYRDFCRRSCCLCGRRHFRLEPETSDLVVTPIFGGFVETIAEVRYNGRKLGPRDYVVIGNRVVLHDTLVPYADCPDEQWPRVDVLAIEIPKINSEELPSWFVQRYGDDVCAGVQARLMTMTGKAWSDPAQAQLARMRYENAVNEARMRYYCANENGDSGHAVATNDLV